MLVVVPAAGAPLQLALGFAAQPRQASFAAFGDDIVAWQRPSSGALVHLPAFELASAVDLAPCASSPFLVLPARHPRPELHPNPNPCQPDN